MISIGIDLSLTGTGIIVLKGNKIIKEALIKSKPSGPFPIDELKRLVTIKKEVMEYAQQADIAVIEGLAFMARNTSALVQLAGLNYLVREGLSELSIDFKIVTPSSLKKFITGKGNSEKSLMLLETYKRFGVSFSNDNICDAYALAMVGQAVVNPAYKLTKFQEEVMSIII